MGKRSRFFVVAMAVAVFFAFSAGTASADEIDPTFSYSLARIHAGTYYDHTLQTTSPSWDLSTVRSAASVPGGHSAQTDTTVTASSISFEGAWETNGGNNVLGQSVAYVWFDAVGDLSYSIAGDWTFGGGSGVLGFNVFLQDLTTGAMLYNSYQYGPDGGVTWSVGGSEGTTPTLTGSATGTLIDGHNYRFYIAGFGTSNSALTGTGWATLELGGTPVPEPSTLALLALGLTGLAWKRRRRSIVTHSV